jgi:hypothetical protein
MNILTFHTAITNNLNAKSEFRLTTIVHYVIVTRILNETDA